MFRKIAVNGKEIIGPYTITYQRFAMLSDVLGELSCQSVHALFKDTTCPLLPILVEGKPCTNVFLYPIDDLVGSTHAIVSILKETLNNGYMPAPLLSFLLLCGTYPNLRRKYSLFNLDTPISSDQGYMFFPHIKRGRRDILELCDIDFMGPENCYAAVLPTSTRR